MERRAGAERAVDADTAAHGVDDAPGNCQTEARAVEPAGAADVALLELSEHPFLLLGRDADAGVADQEPDVVAARATLDQDADAALFGELDRVAGEVQQHLPQPRRIAQHAARHIVLDECRDLDLLGLRARRHQFDRLLHERRQIELLCRQVEASGLDLGEVEDIFDQRQQ